MSLQCCLFVTTVINTATVCTTKGERVIIESATSLKPVTTCTEANHISIEISYLQRVGNKRVCGVVYTAMYVRRESVNLRM